MSQGLSCLIINPISIPCYQKFPKGTKLLWKCLVQHKYLFSILEPFYACLDGVTFMLFTIQIPNLISIFVTMVSTSLILIYDDFMIYFIRKFFRSKYRYCFVNAWGKYNKYSDNKAKLIKFERQFYCLLKYFQGNHCYELNSL